MTDFGATMIGNAIGRRQRGEQSRQRYRPLLSAICICLSTAARDGTRAGAVVVEACRSGLLARPVVGWPLSPVHRYEERAPSGTRALMATACEIYCLVFGLVLG